MHHMTSYECSVVIITGALVYSQLLVKMSNFNTLIAVFDAPIAGVSVGISPRYGHEKVR